MVSGSDPLLSSPQLRQIARFGLVGIAATAFYFVVAVGLPPASAFAVPPAIASLVASAVSLLVSYVGHHRFTFTRSGAHAFYLPRFLILSGLLMLAAALGTHVLTAILKVDYRYAAAAVTVAYPVVSFILNRALVFGEQR